MPTAIDVETGKQIYQEWEQEQDEAYKERVCHLRFSDGDKDEPYTLCLHKTDRALVMERMSMFYKEALRPVCMCGNERCKKCIAILMELFNSSMNDLHSQG